MFLFRKKSNWRNDNGGTFRIDQQVVNDYFDKTQSLVFSLSSAKTEEASILPHVEVTGATKVLDLGCGNGRWGKILIPKCAKYTGVDLSHNFIASATTAFRGSNACFVCLPAQEYLDEERYDYIFIVGLTTYMNDEDIVRMGNNSKSMLTENGKVIVRSVTLLEPGVRRKVFSQKQGLLRTLLRKPAYQIIRRSAEEEIRLFSMFTLLSHQVIEGTGYSLFIFRS